jgi:hypothetical protein
MIGEFPTMLTNAGVDDDDIRMKEVSGCLKLKKHIQY